MLNDLTCTYSIFVCVCSCVSCSVSMISPSVTPYVNTNMCYRIYVIDGGHIDSTNVIAQHNYSTNYPEQRSLPLFLCCIAGSFKL